MNCLISIEGANKRDWIQASSAIYAFVEQVRSGLGHDCYVNCPLEEGLQDFWGPLQYFGDPSEDQETIPVVVSREAGRKAFPKHNLLHAYSRLFLKRDAETAAGTWKFYNKNHRYYERLIEQRRRTSFQWKAGYIAWVPPLILDDSAPPKMPAARTDFWKAFMKVLMDENDFSVQVLDIKENNYTNKEEMLDPDLLQEVASGIREAACLNLEDLAGWLLGASFLICEENWIHDLAACLSIPSFILGCHDPERNTAYHYAFHGFPLRYYLASSHQPFEVLHAAREFSLFQSMQFHVR